MIAKNLSKNHPEMHQNPCQIDFTIFPADEGGPPQGIRGFATICIVTRNRGWGAMGFEIFGKINVK